jgi:hypothetical protein
MQFILPICVCIWVYKISPHVGWPPPQAEAEAVSGFSKVRLPPTTPVYPSTLSLPLVTSNPVFTSIILSFLKCRLHEKISTHAQTCTCIVHANKGAHTHTHTHTHVYTQSYCSSGESDILPLELQHAMYSFASFGCLAFPFFTKCVCKDITSSTATGAHWERSKVSETRQAHLSL